MRIGVVVLNWNNAPDTIVCLESLRRVTGAATVVVVDNGSEDGSDGVVERWMLSAWDRGRVLESVPPSGLNGGDVLMIRTHRNGGYAYGNNCGIRALLDGGVDVVWILNNDTLVAPDAVFELQRMLGNVDGPFIAGTTVLRMDQGKDVVECVGGARYSWATSRSRLVGWGEAVRTGVERRVDYVSGASMLVNRDAIDLVGLLDEDLFLYFEEVDFSTRARRLQIPILVCDHARVWHRGGGTVRAGASPGKRSRAAVRNVCRSSVIVTRKHRPWLVPCVVAVRLGFAVSLALRGGPDLARAALFGLGDGLAARLTARHA